MQQHTSEEQTQETAAPQVVRLEFRGDTGESADQTDMQRSYTQCEGSVTQSIMLLRHMDQIQQASVAHTDVDSSVTQRVCFMVHSVVDSDDDDDGGDRATDGEVEQVSSATVASELIEYTKQDILAYIESAQTNRRQLRLLIRLLLMKRNDYADELDSPSSRLPCWMHEVADEKAGFAQINTWLSRFVDRIFRKTHTVTWTKAQSDWLKKTDPQMLQLILNRTAYVLREQDRVVDVESSSSSDEQVDDESHTGTASTLRGRPTPQLHAARQLLDLKGKPSDSDDRRRRVRYPEHPKPAPRQQVVKVSQPIASQSQLL
ncbi:MAG: hypothetical protein GY739_10585, partial [Mesoflavibacter sp.]|nr:hypothetical protein [Mesoflavibacter sp.]